MDKLTQDVTQKLSNPELEVEIGGEKLLLSDEQLEYINDVAANCFPDDWKNNINWVTDNIKENPTKVIMILFAMSKYKDAWDYIVEYKDKVDYSIIKHSKYFIIDPEQSEYFKYLHDNNIIDDVEYSYFDVINSILDDMDFWKKRFDGHSTSEKLTMLHEAFNGINPYQQGLVEPNEEILHLIFDNIQPDEKLDEFIIGDKPALFFTPLVLIDLLSSGNLDRSKTLKYADIILLTYEALTNSGELDVEIPDDFWDGLFEVLGSDIEKLPLDSIFTLKQFLKSRYVQNIIKITNSGGLDETADDMDDVDAYDELDKIISTVIRSLVFSMYPYRVMDILKDNEIYIYHEKLSHFHYKPEYLPVYLLSGIFDMDGILVSSVLPMSEIATTIAFDTFLKRIYVNGKEIDPNEYYFILDDDGTTQNDKVLELIPCKNKDEVDDADYMEIYSALRRMIDTFKQYEDRFDKFMKALDSKDAEAEKEITDAENEYLNMEEESKEDMNS